MDELLEPEAGIRALWLLYKRGKWGYLSDFGIDRESVESRLEQFEQEHVIGQRLTKTQVWKLVKLIPELEGAGVELRLAYALKQYEGKQHEDLPK